MIGPGCSGSPGIHRLDLTVDGQRTFGFYALPAAAPKGIVVFAHGHGHNAADWQQHLLRTAARDGVIAVAMNYHGEDVIKRYGWRVKEGAADSVQAAEVFSVACPAASTIVMYGVSMGGNTAGLAAAIPAKRASGAPLFNYLFLIEPVTNVTETYLEANAVAPTGNATAAKAVKEIEQEMGGPMSNPAVAPTYLAASDVTHGADIKAAGLKGVVLVHDIDDGQAGYNQTQEMTAALAAQGIATDTFNVVTKQPGNTDDDTWLDKDVLGVVPGYDDPFVGHGSETSTTQLNITTGFDRLAALFNAGEVPHCRQFLVDGHAGLQPATSSPGAC
ncbi:MAG: hypothetical protein M3N21_04935 [Actinomycetota bacterium]|nr:hypothetical protein [Actinomycetota bacterium]